MIVKRITFRESLDYDAKAIVVEGHDHSASRLIGAGTLWLCNRIFRDDKTTYPGWTELIEPRPTLESVIIINPPKS
jgi:hypothetical protein